ncbi:MAG: ABC transporter substrate-binding protein [Pelagibacterales bacterium]|nr:ABC transporter substrate-binding protein [Pelagibacterales bacterium]
MFYKKFFIKYKNHEIIFRLMTKYYKNILIFYFFTFLSFPIYSKELKIAVLKFGSVNWELDVLEHHGLDKEFKLNLKRVQMTNKDAAAIAFLSDSADIFVTDWIWVSKQRYQGNKVSFLPYSTAAGGLIIKNSSEITSIHDLKNKKVGIAGGSIDKSWLLFRAFFKKKYGMEATTFFRTSFAAPPLINGLLKTGDLDAGINYWNYNARLKAQGFKVIINIEDMLPILGIKGDLPLIGYVFKEELLEREYDLVKRFLQATNLSRKILEESDEEWDRIMKLTGARDKEMLISIRDSFRKGIPKSEIETLNQNIIKAYDILKNIGGKKLVGKGERLAEGTIWNAN